MLIAPGRCDAAKEIGGSASTSTRSPPRSIFSQSCSRIDGLHQTANAWRQRRMMRHWMKTITSVATNMITVAAAA